PVMELTGNVFEPAARYGWTVGWLRERERRRRYGRHGGQEGESCCSSGLNLSVLRVLRGRFRHVRSSAHSITEPVRIVRIITRLNIGGPAIQAIEMSARLESAGYHTLLVHGRLGAAEGDMRYLIPADRSFEESEMPALRREVAPLADSEALIRLVGLLRRFRPAIVHTHMAKAGTIGRAAALIYNATAGRAAR